MASVLGRAYRSLATAMVMAVAAAAPLISAAQESPDPASDSREGASGAAGGGSEAGETREDCYKDTLATFIYCWERRSPAERQSSAGGLMPWQRRP